MNKGVAKKMADFNMNNSRQNIRIVRNDENENLDSNEDYQKKIKRHRQHIAILIGIAAVILIVIAIIYFVSMDNKVYTDYTIVNSWNREDSDSAMYTEYGSGYIRYSTDGAAYYSKKGQLIWNQTYVMKNPQIKICEDFIVIGDVQGTNLYILNQAGLVKNIDTSMSINQVDIASMGAAVAVLEDNNANYINMYDKDGNKIYTIKTTLAGDGYPIDVDITDDGTKLIASYVYVSGEEIKTNVVFYNFSDVGQNETERLVGGFNHYGNTIVPEVEFLTDTKAIAIGEDVISIYKIKEYPELSEEIHIDQEIKRVFYSSDYIGVVVDNSESSEAYKMIVYDNSGKQKMSTTFNTEYNQIKFDGSSILMYNDSLFTVMNLNGKVLTSQKIDLPVMSFLSLGTRGSYIMVSSRYIQEIKLK